MTDTIYKICTRQEWTLAQRTGFFPMSQDDARDGYIHLSTAEQMRATAAKHFAGQDDLVLLAVAAGALGGALKWEPSRGGALFPHLYGELPLHAVRWAKPLPLVSDGTHCFPELGTPGEP